MTEPENYISLLEIGASVALLRWADEAMHAEPDLAEFKPEGWVDFRNKELTTRARFGLFIRVENESPRMKGLFGSKDQAQRGIEALRRLGISQDLSITTSTESQLYAVSFDPPNACHAE